MLHTPIQIEIVNVESSSQEFIQLTQNTRPSRTPSSLPIERIVPSSTVLSMKNIRL